MAIVSQVKIGVGVDLASLSESERTIQSAINRLNRLSTSGALVSKSYTQPLGRISGSVSEFEKSLEAANARVVAFGASAGSIFIVQKALQSLVKSTIDVEKSLIEINTLLDLSSSELSRFGDRLFQVASNTGQSFSIASKAALEFSRQGLSLEETLKRTNDALILSRLSGLDFAASTSALTAAMNSFNRSVIDSTELVNKLANVDAAFAVSSADLAEAIKRVGSSAQDAGVGIEELIALVTSAQQVTARGGSVIGNSLKTIFTKIQQPEVLVNLKELGIAIKDASGATLPAVQVLSNFAKAYDGLSSSQKSATTQLLGGVYQINILKAAISDLGRDFSIYDAALRKASESSDQATARNEKLNLSLDALFAKSVNNLTKVGAAIGKLTLEPAIRGPLEAFNDILDSSADKKSEDVGSKLGEGILKGIGKIISGPGTLIFITLLSKLAVNFASFSSDALKTFLGVNQGALRQQEIQQLIQNILLKNPELINAAANSAKGHLVIEEQILQVIKARNIALRDSQILSERLSKDLTPEVLSSMKTSSFSRKTKFKGFIPNYVNAASQEMVGAIIGGYTPGKVIKSPVGGVMNTAEEVKHVPGFSQPFINPPSDSKAGRQHKRKSIRETGVDPYASGGFIPNFADKKLKPIAASRKTVGDLQKTYRSVGRNAIAYNKEKKGSFIHPDDTINSPQIDIVPFSDIKIEGLDQLQKNRDEAEKSVRNIDKQIEINIAAAAKEGKVTSSKENGKLVAKHGGTSALDIIGKNLLAEVKGGEYDPEKIQDKFLRFPIENASNSDLMSKYYGKGFTEGKDDIKVNKGIKLKLFSGKSDSRHSGFIPNFAPITGGTFYDFDDTIALYPRDLDRRTLFGPESIKHAYLSPRGHDLTRSPEPINVLTARETNSKTAIENFLRRPKDKKGNTTRPIPFNEVITSGDFYKGEKVPGKKEGTLRNISSAEKKAKYLSQFPQAHLVDDFPDNINALLALNNPNITGELYKTEGQHGFNQKAPKKSMSFSDIRSSGLVSKYGGFIPNFAEAKKRVRKKKTLTAEEEAAYEKHLAELMGPKYRIKDKGFTQEEFDAYKAASVEKSKNSEKASTNSFKDFNDAQWKRAVEVDGVPPFLRNAEFLGGGAGGMVYKYQLPSGQWKTAKKLHKNDLDRQGEIDKAKSVTGQLRKLYRSNALISSEIVKTDANAFTESLGYGDYKLTKNYLKKEFPGLSGQELEKATLINNLENEQAVAGRNLIRELTDVALSKATGKPKVGLGPMSTLLAEKPLKPEVAKALETARTERVKYIEKVKAQDLTTSYSNGQMSFLGDGSERRETRIANLGISTSQKYPGWIFKDYLALGKGEKGARQASKQEMGAVIREINEIGVADPFKGPSDTTYSVIDPRTGKRVMKIGDPFLGSSNGFIPNFNISDIEKSKSKNANLAAKFAAVMPRLGNIKPEVFTLPLRAFPASPEDEKLPFSEKYENMLFRSGLGSLGFTGVQDLNKIFHKSYRADFFAKKSSVPYVIDAKSGNTDAKERPIFEKLDSFGKLFQEPVFQEFAKSQGVQNISDIRSAIVFRNVTDNQAKTLDKQGIFSNKLAPEPDTTSESFLAAQARFQEKARKELEVYEARKARGLEKKRLAAMGARTTASGFIPNFNVHTRGMAKLFDFATTESPSMPPKQGGIPEEVRMRADRRMRKLLEITGIKKQLGALNESSYRDLINYLGTVSEGTLKRDIQYGGFTGATPTGKRFGGLGRLLQIKLKEGVDLFDVDLSSAGFVPNFAGYNSISSGIQRANRAQSFDRGVVDGIKNTGGYHLAIGSKDYIPEIMRVLEAHGVKGARAVERGIKISNIEAALPGLESIAQKYASDPFGRIGYTISPSRVSEIKDYIAKAKGAASSAAGFIPNFSRHALHDAIRRESNAGIPLSNIKVGSDKSLVTKQNPSGLGVFNNIQERSLRHGIGLAKQAGINPKTKGSSSGFVPNFAEGMDAGFMATLAVNAGLLGMAFRDIVKASKEVKETFEQNKKKKIEEAEGEEKAAKDRVRRLERKGEKIKEVSPVNLLNTIKPKFEAKERDVDKQIADARAESIRAKTSEQKLLRQSARGSALDQHLAQKAMVDEQQKHLEAEKKIQTLTNKKNQIRAQITAIERQTNQASATYQAKHATALTVNNQALIDAQTAAQTASANVTSARGLRQTRGQKASAFIKNGGFSSAAMAAPIVMEQISAMIPSNTEGQAKTKAVVSGVGDVASMAAAGAIFGAPGVIIGGLIGVGKAIMGVDAAAKQFKIDQVSAQLEAVNVKSQQVTQGFQSYVDGAEKLKQMFESPEKTKPQDLIRVQDQMAKSLQGMPEEFRSKFSESLGDVEQMKNIFGEITESLNSEKQGLEAAKSMFQLIKEGDGFWSNEMFDKKKSKRFKPIALASVNQAANRAAINEKIKNKEGLSVEGITRENVEEKLKGLFSSSFLSSLSEIMEQSDFDKMIGMIKEFFNTAEEGAHRASKTIAILKSASEESAAIKKEISKFTEALSIVDVSFGIVAERLNARSRDLRKLDEMKRNFIVDLQLAKTKNSLDLAKPFLSEDTQINEESNIRKQEIIQKSSVDIQNANLNYSKKFFEAFSESQKSVTERLSKAFSDSTSKTQYEEIEKAKSAQNTISRLTTEIVKSIAEGQAPPEGERLEELLDLVAIAREASGGGGAEKVAQLREQLQSDFQGFKQNLAEIELNSRQQVLIAETQVDLQKKQNELQRKLSAFGGVQDFLNGPGEAGFSSGFDKLAKILETRVSASFEKEPQRAINEGRANFQLLDVLVKDLGLKNIESNPNLQGSIASAFKGRELDLRGHLELLNRMAGSIVVENIEETAKDIASKQIESQLKLESLPDEVAQLRFNSETLNALISQQNQSAKQQNKEAFSEALKDIGFNTLSGNEISATMNAGGQIHEAVNSLERVLLFREKAQINLEKAAIMKKAAEDIRSSGGGRSIEQLDADMKSNREKREGYLAARKKLSGEFAANEAKIKETRTKLLGLRTGLMPGPRGRDKILEDELESLLSQKKTLGEGVANFTSWIFSLDKDFGKMGLNAKRQQSILLDAQKRSANVDKGLPPEPKKFENLKVTPGGKTTPEAPKTVEKPIPFQDMPNTASEKSIEKLYVMWDQANTNGQREYESAIIRRIAEMEKILEGRRRVYSPSNGASNRTPAQVAAQVEADKVSSDAIAKDQAAGRLAKLKNAADQDFRRGDFIQTETQISSQVAVIEESIRQGVNYQDALKKYYDLLSKFTPKDLGAEEFSATKSADEARRRADLAKRTKGVRYSEEVADKEKAAILEEIKTGKAKPGAVSNLMKMRLAYGEKERERDLVEIADRFATQFPDKIGDALNDAITGAKTFREAFSQIFMEMGTDLLKSSLKMGVKSLIGAISNNFNKGGEVKGYATGGKVVGGSGVRDDVPAYLSGGEYVIRKASANKYGTDFLEKLNRGALVKRAGGGSADVLEPLDYVYNDDKRPTSGMYTAGNLSLTAIKDENNPQAKLARSREENLGNYLLEKREFERAQAEAIKQFKKNRKKQVKAALIQAAVSAATNMAATALTPATPKNPMEFGDLARASDKIPLRKVDTLPPMGRPMKMPLPMASGGLSPGDDIPAMLTGGEYVMRKDAVDNYGVGFFNRLNRGTVKGYAEGGLVGGTGDGVADTSDTFDKTSSAGGLTNNITISVNITNEGVASDRKEEQGGSADKDQEAQGKALSEKVEAKVIEVLIQEKRAGGILYNPNIKNG